MNNRNAMPQLATPQPARHPQPTVKAQGLTHLIFQRPDLNEAARFLTDFGLTASHQSAETLYLRGTEPTAYCYRVHRSEKPGFVGFGLAVESLKDLEKLMQIPGASKVDASMHPGGGHYVRLTDPSGFIVEAVYGQTPGKRLEHRAPLPWNLAQEQPRINATQRPPITPPEVLKLGHVVIEVADYQATCAWYTRHFGFIPSDVQVLPDGTPIVAFMRLDLGDRPADHHTLAIAQGFMATYSHSAYEVVDADAVGMGQRVLRERGWEHSWGIGRHILGSQIFDYWQDPWGDKHEHYCDGDIFTATQPTGIHPVSPEAMAQWGQRMPKSFTKPRMSFSNVRALIRNLRRSPDLTIGKLITLMRMFG
ncbi:VOC family protein [Pseudomonas chlororaphis]|uniref:VOC family protein n=1 Tax=Pseudomonas chlororaphis TaxID=587753 RepID=UPI00026E510E|nr:VOC family protein [Pseudomonas chlororaphis]EJL07118.1 2,3-dihydroxy-biphenyl-1,2-dioxygenase BphC [Pseudomonas chlororaphis subsp. aureofaciens 30-84]ROL81654.1 glyoxalase [Pseudomonas chlororaphis]ROL89880.1 glyoxalase [Pseudomonas chlororaphis]WDH33156.1 VOC family protein [Pseudomonas chlororaphis]WDH39240.1 VOC family protein [Pseudomonas chlororaphis]